MSGDLTTATQLAMAYEQFRDPDGNLVDLREKYGGHLTEVTSDGMEKPRRV
jgi:hypothetical protein